MKRAKGVKTENTKLLMIFLIALAFRIGMYLVAALIMAFRVSEGGSFTFDNFLEYWNRWDAVNYLEIAEKGYTGAIRICDTCRNAILEAGASETAVANGVHLFLVHYPLYPWLIRLGAVVVGSTKVAGLLISTLTYAGGCVYTYRLIRLDYSEQTAINTVVLMSLFPFSFFFGGIMTEGVFLLISAATLYYIRCHKWWWAILFGILATMTRTQGILLGIPAGIEWLLEYRPILLLKTKNWKRFGEFILRGLSLFFMLIGFGIYLLINWKVEGYAFSYMVYQKVHWFNGVTFPTNCLKYVWENAFLADSYSLQTRLGMWIPEALIAVFSVVLLVYGIKKLKPMYLAYGAMYTIVTYSSTWLISGGRYTICCIPLFLAIAILVENRKWLWMIITYAFAMLQVIYLTGFINYWQIF